MALAFREISHVSASATERQLVRAVREGDDRAFEQLFARYGRRIGAYVFGLIGDHGRAEDITQEVFISALRRLRATEGSIAFRPWIYEIARNACIDEFRRHRRANVVVVDDPGAHGSPVPPRPDDTSPEVRWDRKQQLGDLTGAFSELSDNHHRILVMRELEGLSYGEIAHRLGMTRAMVESTLFRARRRLSHEYDELASGRRCTEARAAIDGLDNQPAIRLGVRARRRIAGHLDHCQACMQYARAAGVEPAALRPGAGKVASLLPVGWLLRLWRRLTRSSLGHHGVASASGQGAEAIALGPAAAAVTALLIAGGLPAVEVINQHQGSAGSTGPVAELAASVTNAPAFISNPMSRTIDPLVGASASSGALVLGLANLRSHALDTTTPASVPGAGSTREQGVTLIAQGQASGPSASAGQTAPMPVSRHRHFRFARRLTHGGTASGVTSAVSNSVNQLVQSPVVPAPVRQAVGQSTAVVGNAAGATSNVVNRAVSRAAQATRSATSGTVSLGNAPGGTSGVQHGPDAVVKRPTAAPVRLPDGLGGGSSSP